MQDIGIGAARVIAVTRSDKTPRIFIELRGVRDAPHAADKDTRLRIAMRVDRAVELRHRLTEVLPPSEGQELRAEILELLDAHHGETGADEDALDTLRRLSGFWREQHPTPG